MFTISNLAPAHVSYQQRYNDGYNAGQDYAACDYNNCDHSDHGYDIGCPNDKMHTYQFCDGYSLGYKTKWNSLAGETSYNSNLKANPKSKMDLMCMLMAVTIT